jgi:hypothetical protein
LPRWWHSFLAECLCEQPPDRLGAYLRMADRLIMHLVDRLPPDSSIDLPE